MFTVSRFALIDGVPYEEVATLVAVGDEVAGVIIDPNDPRLIEVDNGYKTKALVYMIVNYFGFPGNTYNPYGTPVRPEVNLITKEEYDSQLAAYVAANQTIAQKAKEDFEKEQQAKKESKIASLKKLGLSDEEAEQFI